MERKIIFLRCLWALASQNGEQWLCLAHRLCIRHWSIRELSPFLSSIEYVIRVAVFCAYPSKVGCIKHSNVLGLAWIVVIPKRLG